MKGEVVTLMIRFKELTALLVSGSVLTLAGVFPVTDSMAQTPSSPKTVQVKPGGASIFAQPKSSGEVIGEYKSGVILNPTLRVFSNEGQIWLKIGDHWVPEASLRLVEDSSPAPAAVSPNPPAAKPPSAKAPSATPPLVGKPLTAPAVSGPKIAVVTAKDPDVAINVRAQPSTESDSVLAVKPGEQAEVLQQSLGEDTYTWYKLKFVKLGAEGWMRGDFVKVQSATPQTKSQSSPVQTKNPGAITAPAGVFVALQKKPAQQTATQYRGSSGQKIAILKMVKGEDGLAWYNVQFIDNVEAKGWVRGDQVRWLVNYSTPRPAKLTASTGQIVAFYADPSEEKVLPLRGVAGQAVEVLKQTKGSNGYAWYSIKVKDKPTAQGWVKGDNVRLAL